MSAKPAAGAVHRAAAQTGTLDKRSWADQAVRLAVSTALPLGRTPWPRSCSERHAPRGACQEVNTAPLARLSRSMGAQTSHYYFDSSLRL
jgi:hypothetical protein